MPGSVRVQGLLQPGPADLRQDRVRRHLGFQGRLHECDDAERPLPGLLARRVVQDDQSTGAELLVVNHTSALVRGRRGQAAGVLEPPRCEPPSGLAGRAATQPRGGSPRRPPRRWRPCPQATPWRSAIRGTSHAQDRRGGGGGGGGGRENVQRAHRARRIGTCPWARGAGNVRRRACFPRAVVQRDVGDRRLPGRPAVAHPAGPCGPGRLPAVRADVDAHGCDGGPDLVRGVAVAGWWASPR